MQIKSETSKVKWLIDMVSISDLKTNLNVFSTLLGIQKGNITGKDILFLQRTYFVKSLETSSTFYREALLAMSNFETTKGIENIDKWDTEHIFYNPLFLKDNGKTLVLTEYFKKKNVYILDQLLKEKAKQTRRQPFDNVLVKLFDQICLSVSTRKENFLIPLNGEEINFFQVTQKILYEEALMRKYRDHHSQIKWALKLNTTIVWDEVWTTIHKNILCTNRTKTTIWQQIHLNFYTQYSYNKWHHKQDPRPLTKPLIP